MVPARFASSPAVDVTGPIYGPGMDLLAALSLVLALAAAVAVGVAIGWRLATRLGGERQRDLAETVDLALDAVRHERAETMQAALDTVLTVASSKLGDQLDAGREVIDRERGTVSDQVEGVQAELRRITALVAELQRDRAESSGRITSHLERALEVTSSLDATTRSLERALASPKARGQWGERMAEDVLAAAGFIENVNYEKQRKLATGGIPDYTFRLPQGHVVHMDVKFPIDNYLRWLDCAESDRGRLAKAFQRDVRDRVKELGGRCYVDPETTVDYLLLFVPNESVYGFLHEHDPDLIDNALAQKVVLCSPTSLFAVLAVIRQAVDAFLVERRSDEIMAALGGVREQWERWSEPMDKLRRGLSSAQRAYDELAGPRARQLDRQLQKLEQIRRSPESGDPANEPQIAPPAAEPMVGNDPADGRQAAPVDTARRDSSDESAVSDGSLLPPRSTTVEGPIQLDLRSVG